MPHSRANRSILNYNLFGERADLPDVVHCETIAARSVLNNWKFPPHRHGRLHQVLLIESGGGSASLEGREHVLVPLQMINVPAGHVHGYSFLRGTRGFVLTLAIEILDEVVKPAEGLRRGLARAAIGAATPAMRQLMDQIFSEFADRHFGRAHVLRGLSTALIGLVARELADEHGAMDGVGLTKLLARFEALLDRHFADHWTVSNYAEALAITATHLSRVCRDVTGQSASRIIRDRIIREARRELLYTNLPVSTIAYTLGFGDPAYFSRVFSAAVGTSPRQFRENTQNRA